MGRTRTLTIAILLGLLAGSGCTDSQPEGEAAGTVEGAGSEAVETAAAVPSTDFALTDLAGAALNLADYRGDVVILDFWATWCGPCKVVMPHLQKIHEDHAEEGIRVVALSVDRPNPTPERDFIAKHGYTFPVAMATSEVQRAYGGIRSIPTTFIVGPDGAVKERLVGVHSLEDYLAAARRVKPAATEI